MFTKKIIMGVVFGVAALTLAGCGNKAVTTQKASQPSQSKNEQITENSVVQKMPEATGNVDETVNAIVSGATSEVDAALSTDADAKAAVGDGQDTNNLNNTYDENSL